MAKPIKSDSKIKQSEISNTSKSDRINPLAFILVLFAALVGGLIGRTLPALMIPLAIGWFSIWLADWYAKRKNPSFVFIEIVAWLCLIAWFIPVIGLFVSIFIIRLNQKNTNRKLKYNILSYLCLVLSICNSILGILMST